MPVPSNSLTGDHRLGAAIGLRAAEPCSSVCLRAVMSVEMPHRVSLARTVEQRELHRDVRVQAVGARGLLFHVHGAAAGNRPQVIGAEFVSDLGPRERIARAQRSGH
jgi:hypothetical protein